MSKPFDQLRQTIRAKLATRFPLSIAITMFLNMIFYAMISTVLFSFLPKMVKYFGATELNAGTYAGLIASSFYVGQFVFSMVWGYIADTMRKDRALIVAGILLIFTTIGFGLSRGIYWAIVCRFLQGGSMGHLILFKAILADICDENNMAVGLSIMMTAFTVGSITGPSLGGFLAFPAEQYPKVFFSRYNIFGRFGILLPNFVLTIGIGIASVLVFKFIPNQGKIGIEENCKNKDKIGKKTEQDVKSTDEKVKNTDDNVKNMEADVENTDEKVKNTEKYMKNTEDDVKITAENVKDTEEHVKNKQENFENTEKEDGTYTEGDVKNTEENVKDTADSNKNTADGVKSTRKSDTVDKNHTCSSNEDRDVYMVIQSKRTKTKSKCIRLLKEKDAMLSSLLYAFFSMIDIGYNEMLPVLTSTSREYNGMGFTPSQIGTLLMIAPICYIVPQFALAPYLHKRFGSKRLFTYCNLVLAVVYPLLPASNVVKDRKILYTILVATIIVIRVCVFGCYLSINIIVNNSVEPSLVGAVNGFAMSMVSIGQLIAPIMFGSIYSWSLGNIVTVKTNKNPLGFPFNQYLIFFILSICSLFVTVLTTKLPNSINNKKVMSNNQGDV